MSGDGLTTPNDKDLALLRAGKRGSYSLTILKYSGLFIGLLIACVTIVVTYQQYKGQDADPFVVQRQLYGLQVNWADEFADTQQTYREWFFKHGTRTEAMVFDDVSVLLGKSVLSFAGAPGEQLSFFSSVVVSLHAGMMRLTFLSVAAFRACLAVILLAAAAGFSTFGAYGGRDILGQMGNGRLFYSGLRAGLDELSANGAPNLQALGLVCIDAAPMEEVKKTALWDVLQHWGAVNATNQTLAAHLVKYSKTTPYVVWADEETLLKKAFAGGTLDGHAAHILTAALKLHAEYAAGSIRAPSFETPAVAGEPLTSQQYTERLEQAMHRVLTEELRTLIGALSAAEVATVVLAYESGKILAHSFEGGKWIRKSNFPQLSARAVLHAVPSYPKDYDFEQRIRIRRALIYASRRSSFAPVRMPVDLTEDSWALRQWVELLMASPHELSGVSDEVELVGLVRSAHQAWIAEFLDSSLAFSPEIAQNSFSTPSDLLFVPIGRVLGILRKTLSAEQIRRIEHLVGLVSQRQRLQVLEAQDSEQSVQDHPTFDRVYPLLTEDEFQNLSKIHGVSRDDLRDWSALRIVLASYGWLARRVGDYSVPEGALIFGVFKMEGPHKDANDLGLMGRPGVVAFRGSKLEERWGKSWAGRFTYVAGVTMAETSEDYDRLLRGIKDPEDEEGFDSTGVVSA